MLYRVAASSLAALSFALAANAAAQDVATPSNTAGAAAASADAAAPAGTTEVATADATATDGGIQDVVVTATRRETNLQKTPIAISVIGQETIRDRHVQSLLDLADGAVPSLRIATFESRQSALTVGIRGIVPFDANQTARDQGVGVYIDGVYLGRQQGLNAALFDVQRIEVLRGPQGTLFGRNTEGGALNITTVQPSNEFSARVLGGIANFGGYNGEGHINLPVTDTLAVKFDGVIQHQDALVDNPLDGNYGWGYFNRVGGRVSAKWEPVEGLTITGSYDRSRDENTPFYSQLINYNPTGLPVATLAQIAANGGRLPSGTIAPLSPLVVVSGDERMYTADIGVPQQLSVDDTEGYAATIRYKISPAIELRSITAWRGVRTGQWDNSGGAHRTVFLPNANFSRYSLSDLVQNQFSQEFQAVGSVPQFDYVAGLYYFNEHAFEAAATPSSNRWNADGTGYSINSPTVTGPITSSNQGWDRDSRFYQRASRATAKSYAAFAQATFTPDAYDALHLTVGGRYTHDKRDGVLFTVQGRPTDFRFDYDADRFDPMVTLAYDAAPGVNLYAKYATGYRAGGANSRSQTFASFGAEKVKSYEIGAKTEFLDRRVRLNLAGYIMDRTGTQIDFDNVDTNPNSPTFNLHTEETRNAPGTSRIRGVEAELTVRPTNALTLGAGYAYTYTNVPATPNPFLNNALYQVYVVYTPPSAANAFLDYDLPIAFKDGRVRFHLDANYADAQYSFQNEPVKAQSSFIVNGRLALADFSMTDTTKATLSVWTRNLFDETHIYRRSNANSLVLGDYANFNPPRTFGLEVGIAM